MAYLLGLEKQLAQVPGSTELAGTGLGVPALQPRYVLLDAATKRPVPGQQIRRKGQALEVWVDGQLVLVLPAFFTPADGVEKFRDLHLASQDGAPAAVQLTHPEEHTASYLLTEEAWDTENTFAVSELVVSSPSQLAVWSAWPRCWQWFCANHGGRKSGPGRLFPSGIRRVENLLAR